jgi:hypothetical protein
MNVHSTAKAHPLASHNTGRRLKCSPLAAAAATRRPAVLPKRKKSRARRRNQSGGKAPSYRPALKERSAPMRRIACNVRLGC